MRDTLIGLGEPNTTPDERLSIHAVCRPDRWRSASQPVHVYRWIAADKFPPGDHLGPQVVRWHLSVVEAWFKKRGQ